MDANLNTHLHSPDISFYFTDTFSLALKLQLFFAFLCNKAKFEWLHTWHIGLVFSFCEWERKLEHRIQEQLQKKFPIPKTFAILKTKKKFRKSPIFCWPRMTSFARAPGVWCQKQEETRSDWRKPAGWWVTDVHYTLHCGILAKTTRDPVWGGVKVDLTGHM